MLPRWVRSAVIVLFLVAPGVHSASAWGPDGHWIIGQIAQQHLTPKAAKRLQLLFDKNVSLGEIANWADAVREERPETATWHYINIPPSATELDLKKDCSTGDCIAAQIRRFFGIVRLGIRDAGERQEAMKFLVHLVGDLHQPLHAGYGQDQGGNEIEVVFHGERYSLHKLWDTALVARVCQEKDACASRLISSVAPQEKREWERGRVPDWTWESHLLAARVTYGALPDGDPKQISEDYARQASRVVEEQLAKAGIRLAKVINDMWSH